MKKLKVLAMPIFFLYTLFVAAPFVSAQKGGMVKQAWWGFQSIDTMKSSRDLAREKLEDTSYDNEIEMQVRDIAEAGATHVAVATPYDEEFVPFLERWVSAARKYGLNVWFRGNWSGWEGWFGYPRISREEHLEKTIGFIKNHNELFVNGDVFSACPECENGGPGDPRHTGDVAGHREFLIQEYKATSEVFRNLGRSVWSNFSPMNADVARLIMNPETTKALGGIVVVDHYVRDPKDLAEDVEDISEQSGGKIVLGEFGAPIPDVHGSLTEVEQAAWLEEALSRLVQVDSLVGVSYWVNVYGSTAIWRSDGTPRLAVNTLSAYFTPRVISGRVVNEINRPVKGAQIEHITGTVYTDEKGEFEIKTVEDNTVLTVSANGYELKKELAGDNPYKAVVLTKTHENLIFKILKVLHNLFSK